MWVDAIKETLFTQSTLQDGASQPFDQNANLEDLAKD
jgi:hypothetical protein